jgi:AraC-like DNA-binding protein
MGRRPIAIAAAACVLAIGGAAIATAKGGPLGTFFKADQGDRQAQFSKDLATKLGNGVTADQVSKALDEVRTEHQSEMRADLAKGLAGKLDVSQSDVESALRKADDQARRGFRRGQPPRVDFIATVAKELNKSESDVQKAFRDVQKDHMNARLDQLVKDGRLTKDQADQIRKRLDQGPPGFGRRGFRHHGGPGFGPPPGPGGPGGPGGFGGPDGPPPPGM